MSRTNNRFRARVNVKKSVSAARAAGLTQTEIGRLLAGGRLGRTIPDHELKEIAKGITFDRWAMLKSAIRQCDKKLAVKDVPDDIWIAINKAKAEYLMGMSQLTQELDEIGKASPSVGNGQVPSHSFGPREQIGNVTAVQVTIGKEVRTGRV